MSTYVREHYLKNKRHKVARNKALVKLSHEYWERYRELYNEELKKYQEEHTE